MKIDIPLRRMPLVERACLPNRIKSFVFYACTAMTFLKEVSVASPAASHSLESLVGFPVFARRSVFFVQVEWGACALSIFFFADDKPDLFVGKITLARDSRLVALVRATILRLSHSMSAPSSGPYSVPSKSLPGNMVYPSTQGS